MTSGSHEIRESEQVGETHDELRTEVLVHRIQRCVALVFEALRFMRRMRLISADGTSAA